MEIISLTVVCCLLIVALVFLEIKHREHIRDLEDKLAAKNFEQYKYFKEEYPKEVKIAGEVAEANIEERKAIQDQLRLARAEVLKRKGGAEAVIEATRGF